MKKSQSFFCCLFLLFICNFCFTQDFIKQDSTKNKKNNFQHSLFLEFFGSSNNIYNITYDCSFQFSEKQKIAVATGIGYLPLKTEERFFGPYFGFSLQVNYLIGKKRNHFEIGTGITFPFLLYTSHYNYGNIRVYEWENGCYLFGIPLRIGYRYQRANGGFFWKFALVPTYYHRDFYYGPIHPFAGAAIGYTFKNKKE